MFTTFGLVDKAAHMFGGMGLNGLYYATVHWWRGFTFFVVALVLAAELAAFVSVFFSSVLPTSIHTGSVLESNRYDRWYGYVFLILPLRIF